VVVVIPLRESAIHRLCNQTYRYWLLFQSLSFTAVLPVCVNGNRGMLFVNHLPRVVTQKWNGIKDVKAYKCCIEQTVMSDDPQQPYIHASLDTNTGLEDMTVTEQL